MLLEASGEIDCQLCLPLTESLERFQINFMSVMGGVLSDGPSDKSGWIVEWETASVRAIELRETLTIAGNE